MDHSFSGRMFEYLDDGTLQFNLLVEGTYNEIQDEEQKAGFNER
jgi:hypothetical protein